MNPFSKLRKMKVLLIDDDEWIRDSLRLFFETEGCQLIALETAEEGLVALSQDTYDIIIVDYKLPGQDGIKFLKHIRNAHSDAIKILITAYKSEPVISEAKKLGIHVEITTLVIPGVNDDHKCLREIGKRINNDLGRDTPWHLTAYYPAYEFDAPPTPVATLEQGRNIASAEGLNYVYVGNVPGHRYENTYCPNCNTLLIERYIFDMKAYHITTHKTCPLCNEVIPIVGS